MLLSFLPACGRTALLGCGVGTGWGSAVNSAEVRAGQTVIVTSTGGVQTTPGPPTATQPCAVSAVVPGGPVTMTLPSA